MGNGEMGGHVALVPQSCLAKGHNLIFTLCVFVPEASKLVMSYVAAVCGKGQEVNKVKEQLLQSNPVLEGE